MTQAAYSPEELEAIGQQQALALQQGPGAPAQQGNSLEQEMAALQAQTQAMQAEQARLEAENGQIATALTKAGEGALDAVMFSGALVGMGAEGLGAAIGSEGLEKFGRDLGQSAQGSEAISVAAMAFGGDGVDRYDSVKRKLEHQEKAWPMLSTFARIAGGAAVGVAAGASAGAGAAGAAGGTSLAQGAGVAAVEGMGAGAQSAYAADAPLKDVFTSAAIGGVLAGGATLGLGKVVDQFKRRVLSAEAANERALIATGARGTDIRKLGGKELEIGETLRTHKLKDGSSIFDWDGASPPTAEAMAPRMAKAANEVGEDIGAIRKVASANESEINAAPFVSRIRSEILEPLSSGSTANRRLATPITDHLDDIMRRVDEGEMIPADALYKANDDLKEAVFGAKVAMKGPNPPPRPQLEHLQSAKRVLVDFLDQHVKRNVPPQEFKRYIALKRTYSHLSPADQIGQKVVGQNMGNRKVSPSDYITGAAVGAGELAAGNPLGLLKAAGASLAHKFVRERGNAAMVMMYTRLIQDSVQPKIVRVIPFLGVSGTVASSKEIARPSVSVGAAAMASHETYDKRLNELSHAVANPSPEKLSSAIGGIPEEMAIGVGVQYVEKMQALLGDLPKPPETVLGKGRLSSDELRRANAMYEATTDPLSVFDDFASGSLDYDKVQYAWKQYPGLQQAAQIALMDAIQFQMSDEARADIPDNIMSQLDTMLGFQGRLQGTVSPEFSRHIDEMHAALQEQSAQAPSGGGSLQLPSAQPTFTQRIANQ